MNKFIKSLFLIIILASVSLYAEPFIKISEVNYKDEFPKIEIKANLLSNDSMPLFGLDEDNILLYEDGYRVNYLKVENRFNSENDVIYFVLSIDSSKSISAKRLEQFKKSIQEIIAIAENNEKLALLRFNDKVILLNNFTNNKKQILENLDKIERHGKYTLLYDCIYDSIDLLKKSEAESKSIIIFTDGKDEGSAITADDVVKFAKENDVALNFMCLNKSENLSKIQRIAKLTGGQIILGENISEAAVMYKKLIRNLKSLYVIKYNSQLPKDGNKYELEVKLQYGELKDSDSISITAPLESIAFDISNINLILIVILIVLAILVLFLFMLVISLKLRENKNPIPEKIIIERIPDEETKNEEFLVNIVNQELGENETVEDNEYKSDYDSWLVQKNGPELGKKFPIHWNELTVGKNAENTIIVSDNKIEDQHFRIKKNNGNYFLMDLVSSEGTFLNGNKILRPRELYDWDEIKAGNTVFVFRGINVQ